LQGARSTEPSFFSKKATQRRVYALIANQAIGVVNRMRIRPPRIHALLGAGDEESSGQTDRVQSHVVHVTSVHDVETPRLHENNVQHVYIMKLTVNDVNERWNCAAQIQQGV
jgi:hypothetical protein